MKEKIIRVDEDTLEMTEIEIEIDDVEVNDKDRAKINNYAEALRNALGCTTDEFYEKYSTWKKAEVEFKEVYEPFKEKLIDLQESGDFPKNIIIGGVKLTYVSPNTRKTIDTKKLKEEEPEIAKKFTKSTNVAATVRLEGIV